jgi:haloalkane dehalogenase
MTAHRLWPSARLAMRSVDVLDSQMSYVEGGPADAPLIVFLHGNPTSSFLWRNVLMGLVDDYRCLALDLIGMGSSGKPDLDYGFADHARYVEAFADAVGLREVTLIGHDWGAVLSLDLLRRRRDVVARIAVCEGHLHPFASWDAMDAGSRDLFRRLRTPGIGEQLVLAENFFVEQVLPGGMLRTLSREEWEVYRAPFESPGQRWPILRWIQQIPIAGNPRDVTDVMRHNQLALLHDVAPRLLMYGDPGSVVGPDEVAWAQREGKGLRVVGVGSGTHFLPEDQPDAIAAAVRSWLRDSA